MDFEYAIKKDVRNNPIVREVDEARQRQLWRSAGDRRPSWSLVLLFSAWQHFELLRHGYEIQRHAAGAGGRGRSQPPPAPRDRDAAVAARASSGWRSKQLHLVAPARDQAIVIERVTPSAPPEKSIVAAR